MDAPAEYVEAESGKRSDRPKLTKALVHAKAIGATLVFAKLDRQRGHGAGRRKPNQRRWSQGTAGALHCVSRRAVGRFVLAQMTSVAELEAGLISERTKTALAAAKARGVKLGNPMAYGRLEVRKLAISRRWHQ